MTLDELEAKARRTKEADDRLKAYHAATPTVAGDRAVYTDEFWRLAQAVGNAHADLDDALNEASLFDTILHLIERVRAGEKTRRDNDSYQAAVDAIEHALFGDQRNRTLVALEMRALAMAEAANVMAETLEYVSFLFSDLMNMDNLHVYEPTAARVTSALARWESLAHSPQEAKYMPRRRKYRIALRPESDTDDQLDDVVVRDVSMFRMERMDKNRWWLCCYLEGSDERIDFEIIGHRQRGVQAFVTNFPPGPHEYETGSLCPNGRAGRRD